MAASTNEASKTGDSRTSDSQKKQKRSRPGRKPGASKSAAQGSSKGSSKTRSKKNASRRVSKKRASRATTSRNDNARSASDAGNVEYLSDAVSRTSDEESRLIDEIGAEANDMVAEDSGEETGKKKKKSQDPDQVSYLAMYFREMASLDVLKPEEEFTAARHIEELEIVVWEQLLCFAPIVDHLLTLVESSMDEGLAEFRPLRRAAIEAGESATSTSQSKLDKAARRGAESLRPVDVDKQYLDIVLAELARIDLGKSSGLPFERDDGAFREYMRRVRKADRGAAQARNAFVKANLRLVVSIARRFNHGRMALADLIQEGNIGLMKAVERYDYRRGFRFSTYASWWIRHAISRALADKGREVRLPVHMIDAHHRLSKAKRELTAKLGRQPNNEELAEATQLAPDKIEKMRTYLLDQSFSLDRPVNEEDGRSFVEFLTDPTFEDSSPTDMLALQALTAEVKRIMNDLKPIEADILRQRFGLDDDRELTLKQIGEKYNLSRERIRQLQEQALSKMRRALQRKNMM